MALSRIGKRPVELPKGVSLSLENRTLKVKGPGGELVQNVPADVSVTVDGGIARVAAAESLGRSQKAYHGLVRALLANMVKGVTQGYEKKLQVVGTGYSFRLVEGAVGFKGVFSFDRPFALPQGVKAELSDKDTVLTLRSIDKDLLGRTAADIRGMAPPDHYKGKGVRFLGEAVVIKARKGAK